jgi:tetratricopeptide (TPR) repeat protein
VTARIPILRAAPVTVRREPIVLPTYQPMPADRNPMFIENRVYQGSSGKVYPLPFIDRIAEQCRPVAWDAVYIENAFLSVMILPQIGGRIHAATDKTNGYEIFYRQDVIKPALVGLAGPWASGGVEFNWPQHHRPATFMPVEVEVEHHSDGSITVWCGDHDPMARMKGMHGICLHPDRAYIELKARIYNRTQTAQTFLWWANVAARVHEAYQSFFPPDVSCVADHARRSMSTYPLCDDRYYGVDYGGRAKHGVPPDEVPSQFIPPHCGGSAPVQYAPNDLSFYANIPVPTSYMCVGSQGDFFGGYDHRAQAGLVHIASHHISPGKKQWTWGNHDFGYAWDRSLTDPDSTGEYAPYIEIMAGVYTDNQPDFSFLMPGETKTWSQYWYPIQQIGPAQNANLRAAVSLRVIGKKVHAGVSVSSAIPGAIITLSAGSGTLATFTRDLAPGAPWVEQIALPKNVHETDLRIYITTADGEAVISYQPKPRGKTELSPATEPPLPADIASNDELYITGLHLQQYRHATRDPMLYWSECLRRDPGDSRCNNAAGLWHLQRGEFEIAESHFRKAIERQTTRNANPRDGEPLYNLGLTLRHLGRDVEAYAAFYKATWNHAWQSAGYLAIAELDCKNRDWSAALHHLEAALRLNTDHLLARNLRAIVLRKLGRDADADLQLASNRALDPLDNCTRFLAGEPSACDTQTRLDISLDFARSNLCGLAIDVLCTATPEPESGTAPLVHYYRAWLSSRLGETKAAISQYRAAAKAPSDYCFPARVEEIAILKEAMRLNPRDARAPFYLGNLFYDRRRHHEAIALWEKAARLDPHFSIVWRNLGIGYFNISGAPARARAAYNKALRANPSDARLLYESDQLRKRMGEKPALRLKELEKRPGLVAQRDDLSIELCALLNQTGRHAEALALISTRKFQPWEGGEGKALGQHVRTHVTLGRIAMADGDAAGARGHFEHALASPPNLSEAKHLFASRTDVHYWLGIALERLGDKTGAKRQWRLAAESRGDFQDMSVVAFSEMTYYSALSLMRLGKKTAAAKLLRDLLAYARQLVKQQAKIDYFATSLPTMLLFNEDIQSVQTTQALLLEAQALLGLGRKVQGRKQLLAVLARDPSHALAEDLLQSTPPPS